MCHVMLASSWQQNTPLCYIQVGKITLHRIFPAGYIDQQREIDEKWVCTAVSKRSNNATQWLLYINVSMSPLASGTPSVCQLSSARIKKNVKWMRCFVAPRTVWTLNSVNITSTKETGRRRRWKSILWINLQMNDWTFSTIFLKRSWNAKYCDPLSQKPSALLTRSWVGLRL